MRKDHGVNAETLIEKKEIQLGSLLGLLFWQTKTIEKYS